MALPLSVYTIHQAKYVNDRLCEVTVLCRDEPEPDSPLFLYQETVLSVETVIEYIQLGDLFYAQWGESCFNIEVVKLANNEKSLGIVPHAFGVEYSSLARLGA